MPEPAVWGSQGGILNGMFVVEKKAEHASMNPHEWGPAAFIQLFMSALLGSALTVLFVK